MPNKDLHEANRLSWNAATPVHNSHKADQATFLRAGGNTLFAEEVELLGDVRGKTLLHLQCNAGQDTLSIAKHLGAICTGVDISDEAIAFAQKLSQDSGIPATFVRSDVYDWFAQNSTHYDVVFMSYGTIPWLSDLATWGQGVAAALKPGGRYVLVEFHPLMAAMDDGDPRKLTYDYMGGKHYAFDGIGDYVGQSGEVLAPSGFIAGVQNWENPNPSHEFAWGVADVATALLDAGLLLSALREYPYSNGYKPFEVMQALPGGRFRLPDAMPRLPLMFGLAAHKPT